MSATCPLCGLRYAGQSLLDLHIREDHAQRERGREPPARLSAPEAARSRHPSRTRPRRPPGPPRPAAPPGPAAGRRPPGGR